MLDFRKCRFDIKGQKRNIICDCDDVILYTTPRWFEKIMDNRDYFEKYLYLPVPENYSFNGKFKIILNRDKFRLIDWLRKPELSDLEAEKINQDLLSLYNTKDFYNHPHVIQAKFLTNALSTMFGNKNLDLDQLIIVTRCTDNNINCKIKRIKDCFPFILNKLKIECLDINEKKSDIVKKYDNIGIIIDDEMSNIEDILINCDNINGTQILLPKYGYNGEITQEMYDISVEKNIEIGRYS